ncbi:MAG: hypothetical protein A4E65_01715 [Syntrophorhabdus sp. PtaU1.Bin153]|nr:MAG: hypothetical protein A4E65_01715 [Syntrophorhabdus sp. PtaU1.Bin153]
MFVKRSVIFAGLATWLGLWLCGDALAIDSELTRRTLRGLPGVCVIVEDLQPGFKECARKSGLSSVQIEKKAIANIEKSGIKVLGREAWLKTPGRPLLYININTHDDRFRFVYDIRIELRQIVAMEANPQIKTLASTWSLDMAGTVGVQEPDIVGRNVAILVDRFISAYQSANK